MPHLNVHCIQNVCCPILPSQKLTFLSKNWFRCWFLQRFFFISATFSGCASPSSSIWSGKIERKEKLTIAKFVCNWNCLKFPFNFSRTENRQFLDSWLKNIDVSTQTLDTVHISTKKLSILLMNFFTKYYHPKSCTVRAIFLATPQNSTNLESWAVLGV
jgi:hypothetical protein